MEEKKKYVDILEVVNNIQVKRAEHYQSKINKYPRNNFIASDIPDCDKYLTYSVLNWQDKKAVTPDLMARFKIGNEEEERVKRELSELGFQVILAQMPIEIKSRSGEMICRGKIDGKIEVEHNINFPIEIKSMSPYIYDQVETYEDLDKFSWLRKYKRQMQLYLYGNNKETGMILLSNLLGGWKIIPVYLDYGECEFILKRLESAWELVKKKELGKPIMYQEKICGKCDFAHICLPDMKFEGAQMIEDPELTTKLQRVSYLKPYAKEFDKLDKDLKEGLKKSCDKNTVLFVGTDWRIDVSVKEGERFSVTLMPEDVKNQYMKPSVTKTIEYVNIGTETGPAQEPPKAEDQATKPGKAIPPQASKRITENVMDKIKKLKGEIKDGKPGNGSKKNSKPKK